MALRMAYPSERQALKDLWQETFCEAQSFVDWFFAERFLSDFCAVSVEDGLIVSCVHALPCHIAVRDTVLPAVIIGGVSTRKGWEGKGYMRKTMTFLMEKMRERGIALVAHRPQNLKTFFKLGHYPVSDTLYVQLGVGREKGGDTVPLSGDISALFACYDAFSRRYSGMVRRTYADFTLKCRDYLSCDAKCVAVEGDAGVEGYAIYFETEEEIIGEECLALHPTAYKTLAEKMLLTAKGKAVSMRLAGDAPICGEENECVPRSVMGVADVQTLLRAAGVSGAALKITDGTVAGNNGVFDSNGTPVECEPQIEIEAGRLAQWALGYRSMQEMAEAGDVTVFDPKALKILDRAGKRPCFIFDEY